MSEDTSPQPEAETPQQPLLRVIDATATSEQVAAIVAVFAALGGGAPEPEKRRPEWSNPARQMRTPVAFAAGPGGWKASALPR